jgi:hypothetical protein
MVEGGGFENAAALVRLALERLVAYPQADENEIGELTPGNIMGTGDKRVRSTGKNW